jgi:chromosome segregation ATPase
MSFDDIKDHLDRLFAARPTGSSREQAAGLRAALVEFKVALGELQAALAKTERELETMQRELADTERRGGMAAEIGDAETATVAAEYAARLRARVDLLQRKVLVQRDEVHIAEREYELTRAQYQRAERGQPPEAAPSLDDPDPPPSDPLLDRRAKEAAVEAQLAHLKKQLGRDAT